MADNLTIESFDTAKIDNEAGPTTAGAIFSIWLLLNDLDKRLRRLFRLAQDKEEPAVMSSAPTADQNNFHIGTNGIILFTGSTNFNLSGLRTGMQGRRVTLVNIGTATITLLHESASSDSGNRLRNDGGASTSLTTDKTAVYTYLNGKWREESLA